MVSWLLLSLLSLASLAATVPIGEIEDVIPQDEKQWRDEAIKKLWEERSRMGHTPLVRVEVLNKTGALPTVDIFIKNETASKSGTLKHRFVWALTLWAVVERKIRSNTTVYDSTSGNTGSSEAYMCQKIGVNYTAVVSDDLEQEKINQITIYNGSIFKTTSAMRNSEAERLARENGGFFINQFGNADAAEEFHESGGYDKESTNVFHEIVNQTAKLGLAYPSYFVHSAGTGGTISSVGKYITRYSLPTKVMLADSQFSLFYNYTKYNMYTNLSAGEEGRPDWVKPGVAGIGYGYNSAPIIFKNSTSLLRTVIDEVCRMPDMATIAAMRSLREIGIDGGASTALNFLCAFNKGLEFEKNKKEDTERMSIVMIMGDPGDYYKATYYNNTWIDTKVGDLGGMKGLKCWKEKIDNSIRHGGFFLEAGKECEQ